MTDSPARPPEADLLRHTRKLRRMSLREAAAAAGISESRLRQIEAGYQTVSAGIQVPTVATDVTLAHLAKVYGVTAEELEEAQRPDAAEILREMQRPDLRSVPVPDPPPAPDPDFPEEGDDDVAALIKGDLALEAIWRLRDADGKPYPREERIRLMRAHLAGMRARARRAESETGT